MKLTDKQTKLLDFVKLKHGEQVRKYTGEAYFNHCVEVAEIVSKYEDDCIEVALCHDLFEDTNCDFSMLHKKMIEIGYDRYFAYSVCTWVTELTDKFTKEDFSYMNRKKRKTEEAKRLGLTSYIAQTVKYADLINNTSSIVEHDKGFSVVYLSEKEEILSLMTTGNENLLSECRRVLKTAQASLNYL